MRKKIVAACGIIFLLYALTGCGCNHEYDSGTITKEPTCIAEGEKTLTCTLCNETKVESVPVAEHTYGESVTKEPTCSAEGEKTLTCAVCNDTKTESIPKIDHVYTEEVTKAPTFSEKGVMTFTCGSCGDSYKESIPVRDDDVVVTLTDKVNLPRDIMSGRYSAKVQLIFDVANNTDTDIIGVQGVLTISDLFDKKIISIQCDFTGESIAANSSITVDTMGMDINEFMDKHVKLYNTDYADLKAEYEITDIVYAGSSDNTGSASAEDQKVAVVVTDKKNQPIDVNAGRLSPRVLFLFDVTNNSEKAIKGIEGVLTIKDLFGEEIMSANLDFTGQTVAVNETVTFDSMSIEINQFLDHHVKIYNTAYADLKFEYKVNSIVYEDGTTE